MTDSRARTFRLTQVARAAAALGILSILASLVWWAGWPGILLALPVLLGLPGVLRGRLYTYKWLSLLVLIYMAVGLMEAFAIPETRTQLTVLLVSCGALFIGCLLFIRLRALESNPR